MEFNLNGKIVRLDAIPLHTIKPYENNVKVHPVKQLEGLTKSIRQFGFKQPIVIDKNNVIVAGHARYEAAATLGYQELLCVLADDLTEEEINAYRLLDNEIAANGSTDFDKLKLELEKMHDFDFSSFNVEFPELDVKKIDPQCDEDEVPELKIEATSKPGDIWILGNHRLMCGDSINILDAEKLINKEIIEMVFTDPPYGINEKGDREKRFGKDSIMQKGCKYEDFIDDTNQYAIDAYNICEAMNIPIQVWFGANYYCHALPLTNNWLVWDKRVEDYQRDLNSDCELAWVKCNKNSVRIFRHLWKGLIKESERGESRVHPTQKPIALAEWCFNEYGKDSVNILDLFGGSGSTLIACEKTNRKCFMMEISPQYSDIIINRWQKYTGKQAIHAETNKTFNEMSPIV